MEFPANVYPWMLLEAAGRRVPPREEPRRADRRRRHRRRLRRADARRGVSWVAFHNGWVYPIEEIGAFCRERGILFVVDAIQGLGALPIDLRATPVDVLVADAHKWLLGAEACAIFSVDESARDRVPPPFGGWWNIRHKESYLDYGLDFFEGGRRYEAGTLPTGQIFGLAAALGLLDEMGTENVAATDPRERRRPSPPVSRRAAGRSRLPSRGAPESSPPSRRKARPTPPRSASRQRGSSSPPREGAVRFSPHVYNDLDEVRRVLEAAKQ